jgi:hypothetical protein
MGGASHVRAAEVEVPQEGLLMMLSQSPMPGNGASITTQPVTRLEKLRRERVTDPVADVVRDQIRLRDLELIEDAGDVDSLVLLAIASAGMVGQARAAQVRYDDRVVLHEPGSDRRPHVAGTTEAVLLHIEHSRRARRRASPSWTTSAISSLFAPAAGEIAGHLSPDAW